MGLFSILLGNPSIYQRSSRLPLSSYEWEGSDSSSACRRRQVRSKSYHGIWACQWTGSSGSIIECWRRTFELGSSIWSWKWKFERALLVDWWRKKEWGEPLHPQGACRAAQLPMVEYRYNNLEPACWTSSGPQETKCDEDEDARIRMPVWLFSSDGDESEFDRIGQDGR